MNQRIKELAKQAYEDVIKNTPSFLVTKELYEQKFAELIVKECMHECLRMQLGNQYTPEELLFQTKYRKIIKEHFGVEE
jgi:hypothetical protein